MTKPYSFKDHAGRTLAGLYDAPAGLSHFPLVILMHGHTGWKEETHLETLAHALADTGIAAFRFDAPATGESEGSWETDYLASNFVAGILSAYHAVQTFAGVQKDTIGLWGHSMGGMSALAAASRNPGRFRAVCGCEPSRGADFVSEENARSWKEAGSIKRGTEKFGTITLPYAFYEDRVQYRTEDEVKALTAPTLFIAGKSDDQVEASFVREVYENSGAPSEYLEMPMGHMYKQNHSLLALTTSLTVAFFSTQLQAEL